MMMAMTMTMTVTAFFTSLKITLINFWDFSCQKISRKVKLQNSLLNKKFLTFIHELFRVTIAA